MGVRIPKRQNPTRVTVVDAFAHILAKLLVPNAGIDLGGAVYFSSTRVNMSQIPNSGQSRDSLPPTPYLTLDPIDVAIAIHDGIISGALSVQGLPEAVARMWIPAPYIQDWTKGIVWSGTPFRSQGYRPTLDLSEIDRLFDGEEQPTESDKGSQPLAEQTAKSGGRVNADALKTFVRATMASERLTEPAATERARLHFAPKIFTVAQWRAAWREEPNKFERGEKPKGKSDA